MLGLGFWVGLAYVLSILSAILCFIYGVVNWNRGDEPVKPEDVKWAKDENEAEEVL